MTKRMLLVAPGFHGYHLSIAGAYGELGYDVTVHCYDAARSSAERAWNKVRHELPNRLRGQAMHMSAQQASERATARLREVAPDVVLVVRGDVLDERFWHEAAAGGRPTTVWLYDELSRMAMLPAMVAQYAQVATYSASDAKWFADQGISALHVHNGFDHRRPILDESRGAGRVTLIGASSARRAELLQTLVRHGLPVQAFGRDWSDHPVDRLRTWRARPSGVPNGRDLPGGAALGVMRTSAATLNVHGAQQDGFTMRTFEAAGAGAVQLVDRDDIDELYEPGEEVLVFRNTDELVELAQRVVAEPAAYDRMRRQARARTLAEHTMLQRVRAVEERWR